MSDFADDSINVPALERGHDAYDIQGSRQRPQLFSVYSTTKPRCQQLAIRFIQSRIENEVADNVDLSQNE